MDKRHFLTTPTARLNGLTVQSSELIRFMGIFLQQLLRILGLKRLKQHYHVDVSLAESLENLALEQARDPQEIAADILAEGIAKREQTEQRFGYWEKLSPREQEGRKPKY